MMPITPTCLVACLFVAAEAPAVVVLPDHTIAGTVTIQASPDTVRALVGDPVRVAGIDNTGVRVSVAPADGACQTVTSAVTHPIASVRYTTRQCPTADGFLATLVTSEQLKVFSARWSVQAAGPHTLLRYELKTVPSFPVPQFVIEGQSKSAVAGLLSRIQGYLEGPTGGN